MTRRVARAALAYAAVGARARVCEVTIQVDGAGVGLAFANDVELDAAVRGFVARFALPLDQMGCADDGCAVEYIKAHARLNAACDAASPDYAAPLDDEDTARSEPGASPLDDDDAARYEPDAAADAGEREAAGEAAPAGSAALLPSTLEDYVTLWMVAWSACFAVAAVVAALDRALDLRVEDRCPRFRRAFSLPRGARRWLLATGGFAALLDARGNLLPNLHDALHGPGGLCRVGAVGHASLHDVKVEGASYALYALEAALGAAQLFAASRDAPASPLRETLLWVLLHSSERACSESHGLGKQWAYAALVQLWVALTPDDPGPSAGAVGVLFQIWATHAFAGAEKAGLGREEWVRTGGALRAALSMPVYAAPLGARAARAIPPRLGGVLTRGAVLFELGLGPLLLARRRAVGAALVLFHGVNLWTLAIFEFPLVALGASAPLLLAPPPPPRGENGRRGGRVQASLAALLVYANARVLCASCNATLKSRYAGALELPASARRLLGGLAIDQKWPLFAQVWGTCTYRLHATLASGDHASAHDWLAGGDVATSAAGESLLEFANRDFGARPHSVWGGLWGWSAMGSAHLHSMQNRPRADTRVQRRVCDSLLAAPPRDAAVAAATADGYDAEVQPDGGIHATFHFTWRGAQRSFAVAVPGGGALWSARDASRDVGAACDDAGVPAADCDATLKPHVLAALRDLARPASVSRVDLCKPDDTVGDVEAFVAASVSVAKITTLDCATDEVRNEDVDLPRPVHM